MAAVSFSAALQSYAQERADEEGWTLYFSADEALRPLAGVIEAICFDLVREALSNIHRHAYATRVWLRLGLAQDVLLVTVRDDGAGFDPERARRRTEDGTCRGLAQLRERIHAMDGTLEIRTAPREGSTVVASLPLRPDPLA